MKSPRELIVEIFFKDYDFQNKNVIEFGPCMTEDRMGILRHLFSKQANLYAIDACDRYGQTHADARRLAQQYGIELTIADYGYALLRPHDQRGLKDKYKFLKANFFDVILCQCSVNLQDLEKFLVLCNEIGKKDCKVFCLPWLNSSEVTASAYERGINNIDYSKYGFKMSTPKPSAMGKINYRQRHNAIITKNINHEFGK